MKYLIFTLTLMLPTSTFAATLFVTPQKDVDQSIISISLDTGGVEINTISISLSFNDSEAEFAGYDASNSPIQFWVDRPHLSPNGNIKFSGIIPGGAEMTYIPSTDQKRLYIADIIFKGSADVFVESSSIFIHDGKGTLLEHSVVIEENAGSKVVHTDTIPPEQFELEFLPSSLFSRTPSFLVFNTEDYESGISHYELKIGRNNWDKVESPKPIMRHPFSRTATVRAYDYSGNVAENTIRIAGDRNVAIMLGAVGFTIVLLLAIMFIKRRL